MDKLGTIRRERKQIEVILYHWDCPRCGHAMVGESEPQPDDWWRFCEPCQEALYEEQKVQWLTDFRRANKRLIGAVVSAVNPEMDDFSWSDGDQARMATVELECTDGAKAIIRWSDGELLVVRYAQPEQTTRGGKQ